MLGATLLLEVAKKVAGCAFCGGELGKGPFGRRDECPKCGGDVHCCLNCRFHDPHAHNQCREPQAEPVTDRDRANFCDFFSAGAGGRPAEDPAAEARRRLDALFKKG
jgi:hypothetical protein